MTERQPHDVARTTPERLVAAARFSGRWTQASGRKRLGGLRLDVHDGEA